MAVDRPYLRAGVHALAMGLAAGCVPIPVPPHGLGVVPDRNSVASFSTGASRRADVLLKLGEPRYRLDGDRFLMYEWDVSYGYLLVGGPGAATAVPVVAPHYLCFEFGPDASLVRKTEITGSIYGKPDEAIGQCMNPAENVDEKSGE